MQYEEDYFILACTVRIGADKFGMLKIQMLKRKMYFCKKNRISIQK